MHFCRHNALLYPKVEVQDGIFLSVLQAGFNGLYSWTYHSLLIMVAATSKYNSSGAILHQGDIRLPLFWLLIILCQVYSLVRCNSTWPGISCSRSLWHFRWLELDYTAWAGFEYSSWHSTQRLLSRACKITGMPLNLFIMIIGASNNECSYKFKCQRACEEAVEFTAHSPF